MKRRFTFLLAAVFLLVSGLTWGQTRDEVSITFSEQGYSNAQSLDGTPIGLNDYITIQFDKNTGSTAPAYYNTGTAARLYGGNTLTITPASGCTVTGMTLTFSSTSNVGTLSVSTGTYSLSSTTGTWTGSSSAPIVITNTASSGHARVKIVSVTYSAGGQQAVATPTFSPAAGTYYEAQNVTISCTTAGATIYYTLDGSTPTTSSAVYSSPIAISATTTVKAMAAKSGMSNSSVASATYTIEEAPTVITIAAARALEVNEYALVQGIITFIDGRNVYVQDETAGIDLFLNNNTVPSGLALGDKVQAYGKKTLYNGLVELSGINGGDASQFSVISTGNTLPLAEKTIAEILTDHAGTQMLQSTRVKIVEATIGTINTSGNTPLTQGENTINIYKVPALDSISAGDAVDVVGVVGCFNNPQLRVAVASDVTIHETPMLTVATPTLSPAGGEYTEAQTVTVACATEGASIYYTIDGTDPMVALTGINGTLYTEALTISETTTVKAIAVKEGMNNSEIATATYTINIAPPVQETAYTLITHNNALISGDKYIIVGIKGETYKALGKQATNNRTSVDVTPAENVITLTPATSNEGGVFELTLGQADGKWTLYDAVNGGYLYAASSSANYLKVQAENDANGQWTIDIATNGVATIKAQGTNTRNWLRLNNNGSPFSCYASGQLDVYLYKAGEVPTPPTPTYYTVSIAEGITNGTISVDTASYLVGGETITVTADAASGYELTALTYTYAGVATPINILETMQFVMPNADVTVNATFTELAHVANPTFTPAAGSFIQAQQVTIACATEGATIHYTLDGTDPTANSPVYAEAIVVSATTTVKAMAVKEGMNNSNVTSATYTIIEPITMAAARVLTNNEYGLVQGVVTFIDGRNIYAQDATAGIDLYLNSNTVPEALAIGDMVLAYGKKTVYNGLVELTGINGGDGNQFVILSNGNELPVVEKTIAEILADHNGDKMLQSTRVQIVNATVGNINNNNNTPITQGESTLNIYKLPVVEGLEEGDFMTVIGVIGCYNNPQLRVNSAEDVTFTHPAGIFVNPAGLSGFNYVYGEGPSTVKTFNISARSLTAPTYIHASENFEISSFPGESFYPENTITINTYTGTYSYTIKVRLKAGLEMGDYEESLTIAQAEVDTMYIALSGSVTDQPQPTSNYVRISDLSQLTNGAKVVFAARFDSNASDYYAMTAQASGKPTGVLFTSVAGETETLPASITDEEATYYWTVATDGTSYTFTNANGDVLGYTSSTNFATGGDNTAWTIEFDTSGEGAMVPNYGGFVVSNVNNAVRAIALNSNHNFGPYHTQNLGSDQYNFFLDMFVTAGGGTPTCAMPSFSPEGGTYYEAQEVTISCSTADATIYYTLDGSDPTAESTVYTEPISVEASVTIKAIAMKEGFNASNIATAEYTLILGAATVFNQDWEGEMNGWTFVAVEGNKPWNIASYSGNHYAYANGYNGGANQQWCISPAFNLNMYSNATLTFRNAKNYSGPDLQLFFSNNYDGENPASTATTWTELGFNMSTGSFAWAESGIIDLANFTGENCYIGFKYTSTETEAAAWEVDDIVLMGFTSDPYLTVTPSALSGFTYIVGNGPSAAQTFTVSGGNLPAAPGGTSGGVTITCSNSHYEFSLDGTEYWHNLSIEAVGTLEPTDVYVRLEAGLPVGPWDGVITLEDGGTTATVTVSGTVTEEPTPGGDWNRILSLTDLNDGDQVIIAARYDATVGDGYYAMTAGVSGKPDGVLFTSVNNNGTEMLPAEIADAAETYLWNVTFEDEAIILVNAAGDSLGYSSSTNFAGNTNALWNIAMETSGENALIPNYTGFVITNATTTNRGIAKNSSHKFGAYATSNMNNPDYSFYLDLFVMGGSVTPTVATPVISVASGTYYEEFDVEITCATEGATIYYTTDGTDPTAASTVYTEAIHVDQDMTLKAIAMMEGYENSGIATATYEVNTELIVIFNQDWEGEMNGWTFVTVEGNKPWTIGTYSNNQYAMANGYGDDVDNEQWCISPAFNLNNYLDVTLTFRNATKFDGPALELYFANDYDGQDPTAASWQPLEFNMSEGNYVWAESGEISLDGFSGTNCNIAFRYISTIDDGAAAWEIDDILLTAAEEGFNVNEVSLMEVNLWNAGNEIAVENNTDSTLQMVVFDVLGQQVLAKTIASGSVRFSHNLNKGMYIVTLVNGNESKAGKIIVR